MTAKEFLTKNISSNQEDYRYIITDAMIEFAQYHVELALKEASISSSLFLEENRMKELSGTIIKKSNQSILTAYPLENIK